MEKEKMLDTVEKENLLKTFFHLIWDLQNFM